MLNDDLKTRCLQFIVHRSDFIFSIKLKLNVKANSFVCNKYVDMAGLHGYHRVVA